MDDAPAGPAPPGAVTVAASYAGADGAAPGVRALLRRADVVLVLGPPGRADLAALDAVARLALAARRAGRRLVVRAPELEACAALCGLAGALAGSAQPGGQPQPGEQLGAEEVVDVGDPPA